jgi:hypothetical protein
MIKDNKFECLDDRKELFSTKKNISLVILCKPMENSIYEGKKDSAGYCLSQEEK